MSGVELIAAERKRQKSKEGYDAARDDEHHDEELAKAAVCYIAHAQDEHPDVEALYPRDRWNWLEQTSRCQHNADVKEALITNFKV